MYPTHCWYVAVVDPAIGPPALSAGPMPRLDVEVSETSVAFTRDYPPAPLAKWHAPLLGVGEDEAFAQREEGRFVTPALWVDSWHVLVPALETMQRVLDSDGPRPL